MTILWAIRSRAIEAHHQQMKIDRERVHVNDFGRLGANEPCAFLGEALVIRKPRPPRSGMTVDGKCLPVLELFRHARRGRLRLQSERVTAEIELTRRMVELLAIGCKRIRSVEGTRVFKSRAHERKGSFSSASQSSAAPCKRSLRSSDVNAADSMSVSGHRFAERKGVVASERDFAGAEKLHDVAQHPRVMDERIDEETAKIVAR